MESYTLVALTRAERSVFDTVLRSIGIAFPDLPPVPANLKDMTEDQRQVRALTALAKDGAQIDHRNLLLARDAVERQVAQCAIESDVEHWKRHLLRPERDMGKLRKEAPAGVPIVADPLQMCAYLAEARTLQLREATAAMTLIREALSLATPKPDMQSATMRAMV
jgi:hypothetical protein